MALLTRAGARDVVVLATPYVCGLRPSGAALPLVAFPGEGGAATTAGTQTGPVTRAERE